MKFIKPFWQNLVKTSTCFVADIRLSQKAAALKYKILAELLE